MGFLKQAIHLLGLLMVVRSEKFIITPPTSFLLILYNELRSFLVTYRQTYTAALTGVQDPVAVVNVYVDLRKGNELIIRIGIPVTIPCTTFARRPITSQVRHERLGICFKVAILTYWSLRRK